MIKIERFVFNPFQVNTYILYNHQNEGFVIDPACYGEEEEKVLLDFVREKELNLKAIINTHCHVDHLLGVEFLREKLGLEFWCSKEEEFLIENSVAQGEFFGFQVAKPAAPDRYLTDNETITLGEEKIQTLHIPGHSPGSLTLYLKATKVLITGDVLFAGSIGRTDLPGGNYETLISGIKNKLFPLQDDLIVYPGHGPSSSLGREKLTNPFLQ